MTNEITQALTTERLTELRRLLAESTPCAWKTWGNHVMADTGGDSDVDKATLVARMAGPRTFNADLICAMQQALPALLDMAHRLLDLESHGELRASERQGGGITESPWARFLGARAELIHKARAEGESDEGIARWLSADPGQVGLIAATPLRSIVCTRAWLAERTPSQPAPSGDAAMARWVPVTERLPEKAGMYLCFHPDHGQDVILFTGKAWGKTSFWSHEDGTHWMPLPAPPGGAK